MNKIFPKEIINLPEADIDIDGLTAHLSQGDDHQILFMKFEQDTELPEHSHKCQWGVVLEGTIELTIDGVTSTFKKGDRYYIPSGIVHSGKIYAGYSDMTFFGERDRYFIK